MSWADQRARLLADGPIAPSDPPSTAEAPAVESKTRILRVDELRAVVAVLDGRGDGTATWTDRVLIEKKHQDVERTERVLPPEVVAELRRMPAEQPWRTRSDARKVGDGWLAVADPETGDVHQIRATDATAVWWLRANA
jgi:hypothetical protein